MKSYSIYPFVIGILLLNTIYVRSSRLLNVSVDHSFLLLSNISGYEHTKAANGCLGCFYFEATMKTATMNSSFIQGIW